MILTTPITALKDKTVLITGGTGSFGQEFAKLALQECSPRAVRIYSRGEYLQSEMARKFNDERLRFLIGDVRDQTRLRRALQGVDVVVHAAALKQVPTLEYNPIEAVQTNIQGAVNLIDAALDAGVEKVLAIGSDKEVHPVNLYGATKLVAEKLFVQANAYSGESGTRFSCTRYGNVIGSRGSVIPLFLEQKKSGRITITDEGMTRFWLTLEQGARFVLECLERMLGKEILVPRLPSATMLDVAEAVAPGVERVTVGLRPGEKMHETLIAEEESTHTVDMGEYFVVLPEFNFGRAGELEAMYGAGKAMGKNVRYGSDNNRRRLGRGEMVEMVERAGLLVR